MALAVSLGSVVSGAGWSDVRDLSLVGALVVISVFLVLWAGWSDPWWSFVRRVLSRVNSKAPGAALATISVGCLIIVLLMNGYVPLPVLIAGAGAAAILLFYGLQWGRKLLPYVGWLHLRIYVEKPKRKEAM